MITNKETESVIQKLPTNKSPGQDDFVGEFYYSPFQTFWKICIEKNASEFILQGQHHHDTKTR